MPSWQDSLIIMAGLLRDLHGDNFVVGPEQVPLAVWPMQSSGGPRATYVLIRAGGPFHLATQPQVDTAGANSAYFAADTEYLFPLHPATDTLFFLDAQSTSSWVRVRWTRGR